MAIGRAKRGRPPTFESETRKMLAGLIRQYGARRARELAPVPVSIDTLRKIARENGITLKRGRRPDRAA